MASPLPRLGFAVVLVSAVLCTAAVNAQVEVVPATTLPLDLPPDWYASSRELGVAGGADGRVIAVWAETDYGVHGSRPRAVASRVFDPITATLEPVVRRAITKGAEPRLAVSASHSRYFLPWAKGPDTSNRQLIGSILDVDGLPLTSPTSLEDEFMKSFGVWAVGADGGDAGHVLAWGTRNARIHARRVGNDGSSGIEVDVGSGIVSDNVDAAITPDHGFVVAYGGFSGLVRARGFDAVSVPKDDPTIISGSGDDEFQAVAASPVADVVAVLYTHVTNNPTPDFLIVQLMTSAGHLGTQITVAGIGGSAKADLAYDRNGDLYVVWVEPGYPPNVRAFYPDGTPVGPAVSGTVEMGSSVKTTRLANGDFLNVFSGALAMQYNVMSLCVPGSSVCGDGTLDPLCEACDAGVANSDVVPDACRIDCEPARCGDSTIDSGETCDDGNTVDCDGCSSGCTVEAGLGCGDAIPFPSCGEACDDGNAIEGDGCDACTLERAPGGGSSVSDCFAAWSIDNAANEPRFDKNGAISSSQVCTDNDSRCDFDGGTTGSCTFHLRVCVNNTDLAACTPGTRLASWELHTPSASQVATKPPLAAVRDALMSVVPGGVVGPSQPDTCSAMVAVPVALRGTAGDFGKGTITVKTRAALYDGRSDSDKLRLECRAAP